MTETHPSLKEVIHDEQGEYAKEQVLLLVRQLQSGDIETRAIARALFNGYLHGWRDDLEIERKRSCIMYAYC